MNEPMSGASPTRKLNASLAAQVDDYLEKNHTSFVELGNKVSLVFDKDRKPGEPINTQVRNLQQIVVTATSLVEIEDFIKNQMGKDAGKKPESPRPWLEIGKDFLEHLKGLRDHQALEPGGIPETLVSEDRQLVFRLRLARGWVCTVVGQYLYLRACKRISAGKGASP